MQFHTTYHYRNREEKARYVWLKYMGILTGKILDVGADQGYLRSYVPAEVQYTTVGLEAHHDIRVDLEKGLPLESNSYDCVLCLDVLEHIENVHQLFDELCRITRRYLIVSLPNPWADLLEVLKNGYYAENRALKWYNLPADPPDDRHRWFFNASDAKRFLEIRGRKNNMNILQIDQMGLKGLKKKIYRFLLSLVVHKSVSTDDLVGRGVWACLEKEQDSKPLKRETA